MAFDIQALAVALPRGRHPNRIAFRGVLAPVDAASDRPPEGARGHRVLLTRAAAEAALPSLLGMALDYVPALDRHDARRKVGLITEADVGDPSSVIRRKSSPEDERRTTNDAVLISGYLFARDFPELVRELRTNAGALGMSYEITDARVADLRAPVWVLTEVTFTGAAILRREKAAYQATAIELAAPTPLPMSSVAGRPSSAIAAEAELSSGRRTTHD